ncbi:MAG: hypothetical protein GY869_08405 [Planctomycetes bacterium]|nr:hypothetical protein [Planctomycetota bacterium]
MQPGREVTCFIVLLILTATGGAEAQSLSIYSIQHTEDAFGASPFDQQLVDCKGGVVVKIFERSIPRILIQDPNYPDGWGAIQVKDRYNITNNFAGLQVGDYISLKNVHVEDYRGTTFLLLFAVYNPQIAVLSRNNPIPEPLVIDPNQIAAPVEDINHNYYITNHDAEKYESMIVRIENVSVMQLGRGKANDNYVLQQPGKPEITCWATDYINADKSYFDDYCPEVQIGQKFCILEGMLEQYYNASDGFDYYQLLTSRTEDFYLPIRADFDQSCRVNLVDYAFLARHWLELDCQNSNWCDGADLDQNDSVDLNDGVIFSQNWLFKY